MFIEYAVMPNAIKKNDNKIEAKILEVVSDWISSIDILYNTLLLMLLYSPFSS